MAIDSGLGGLSPYPASTVSVRTEPAYEDVLHAMAFEGLKDQLWIELLIRHWSSG